MAGGIVVGLMEEIFHLSNSTLLRAQASKCFLDLKRRMRLALPASAEIVHVGATAIQHCWTKGDVDIVVRVSGSDFSRSEQTLRRMFKQNSGSYRSTDFSAFESQHFEVPIGIQLTAIGGRLDFFIRFRDKLIASSKLVAEYNHMKRRCNGQRMDRYRAEKTKFIEAVLRTASV